MVKAQLYAINSSWYTDGTDTEPGIFVNTLLPNTFMFHLKVRYVLHTHKTTGKIKKDIFIFYVDGINNGKFPNVFNF